MAVESGGEIVPAPQPALPAWGVAGSLLVPTLLLGLTLGGFQFAPRWMEGSPGTWLGMLLLTLTPVFLPVGLYGLLEQFVWRRRHRRRTQALARTAAGLGLSFAPAVPGRIPPDLPDSLPLFRLTREVRRVVVRHLLAGDLDGWPVLAWDHGLSGRLTTSRLRLVGIQHYLSLAALRFPAGPPASGPGRGRWPAFQLTPADGVAAALFFEAALVDPAGPVVRFDDPEFEASCVLRAWDEAAVRALFTPAVRAYFAESPGLWVECADGWLLAYPGWRGVATPEWPRLLLKTVDVAEVLLGGEGASGDGGGGVGGGRVT